MDKNHKDSEVLRGVRQLWGGNMHASVQERFKKIQAAVEEQAVTERDSKESVK